MLYSPTLSITAIDYYHVTRLILAANTATLIEKGTIYILIFRHNKIAFNTHCTFNTNVSVTSYDKQICI